MPLRSPFPVWWSLGTGLTGVTGVVGITGWREDGERDEAWGLCGVLVTTFMSRIKTDQQGSLPQCGPQGACPPGLKGQACFKAGFPGEEVIKLNPQMCGRPRDSSLWSLDCLWRIPSGRRPRSPRSLGSSGFSE